MKTELEICREVDEMDISEIVTFVDQAETWTDLGVEYAVEKLCNHFGIDFHKYDYSQDVDPYTALWDDITAAIKEA